MDIKGKKGSGVKLLKEMYRKKFRIPENINYYSKEDFKKAETLDPNLKEDVDFLRKSLGIEEYNKI